jgi:peroxiredoxin (alkyl hydroperoxide reductase subunit C)
MQKSDVEDVSTPADWQPGDDVVIHPPRSMEEVEERLEKAEDDVYCLDWFMCLRKESKK